MPLEPGPLRPIPEGGLPFPPGVYQFEARAVRARRELERGSVGRGVRLATSPEDEAFFSSAAERPLLDRARTASNDLSSPELAAALGAVGDGVRAFARTLTFNTSVFGTSTSSRSGLSISRPRSLGPTTDDAPAAASLTRSVRGLALVVRTFASVEQRPGIVDGVNRVLSRL